MCIYIYIYIYTHKYLSFSLSLSLSLRLSYADLACGIGGFSIAARALGATTTRACDINRTAVEAYNAAHSHALTRPAECHPIELRTRWGRHVGTDVISAGFPCQAFSRVGLRQGYREVRGQVIFHLIQLCWVLRPRFMVLECVWPFVENPQWTEPVCDYFRAMGYGVSIRKEQASDYLAQVRTRGILTVTRADYTGTRPWGPCEPSSQVHPRPGVPR